MTLDRLPEDAFLIRPLLPEESAATRLRSVEAFGASAPHGGLDRIEERAAAGELWAAEVDGIVMAHCRTTVGEHWLLGGAVPCQRIASVSVAPEHRGRGAGGALMRAMVRKGYSDGLALSVLFPATTAMYRGMGWELAGEFERVRLSTRGTPPVGPPLRRADEPDWDGLRACQASFAMRVHGAGTRSDERWDALREATELVYALDDGDGVEAYALVRHRNDDGDWRYVLAIEDWAAVTPRGLEAVLGFVGRHDTLAKAADLPGPAIALLGMHLPEQSWEVTTRFSWMARALDLGAIMSTRGFPPGAQLDVSVEVQDPLLPELRGPWRLLSEDGKGRVEAASEGDVRLDARALGPLVTGFQSAEALALAGLVDGAADELARLSAMFAAPTPRFLDFF